MKNIKIKHSLLAIFLSSATLFSCYDDNSFLDDNLTLTGRHFPVIADFYIKESSYAAGATANAIVVYWSEGTISELKLYATVGAADEILVSTTPYSPNFVDSVRADIMVIPYTVPNTDTDTKIELKVSIVNTNSLTKSATDSFDVE